MTQDKARIERLDHLKERGQAQRAHRERHLVGRVMRSNWEECQMSKVRGRAVSSQGGTGLCTLNTRTGPAE